MKTLSEVGKQKTAFPHSGKDGTVSVPVRPTSVPVGVPGTRILLIHLRLSHSRDMAVKKEHIRLLSVNEMDAAPSQISGRGGCRVTHQIPVSVRRVSIAEPLRMMDPGRRAVDTAVLVNIRPCALPGRAAVVIVIKPVAILSAGLGNIDFAGFRIGTEADFLRTNPVEGGDFVRGDQKSALPGVNAEVTVLCL